MTPSDPKAPPATLTGAVITRFAIAAQQFQNAMERRLAPHGLTLVQLSVLSHMVRRQAAGARAQRITQIARAVDVNQPGVTKIMTKFEAAGWITFEEDPHDKRARAARATPAAQAHLAALMPQLFAELGAWLSDWPDEEKALFLRLLERLSGFFDDNRRLDAQG